MKRESTGDAPGRPGPGKTALIVVVAGLWTWFVVDLWPWEAAPPRWRVSTVGEQPVPPELFPPPDELRGHLYYDESTGLAWLQETGEYPLRYAREGLDFCAGLERLGMDDWRLPDLDELRTLITGCLPTQTGGRCPTTSATPQANDRACAGCGAADRCYWPAGLEGECGQYFAFEEDPHRKSGRDVYVDFRTGEVINSFSGRSDLFIKARCVRRGPWSNGGRDGS